MNWKTHEYLINKFNECNTLEKAIEFIDEAKQNFHENQKFNSVYNFE